MPTLTVYPDANPGTTTMDGRAARISVNETFATILAGAGNFSAIADTTSYAYIEATTTSDQFGGLHRSILLFDTSSLPIGATITAATLSVWGVGKNNGLGSPDLVVVASNPAANTTITNSDYSTLDSTSFGSVVYGSFTATDSAYTDIALNASGIAAIVAGGITKLGLVLSWDQTGTFGGSWFASAASYFQFNMADNASGQSRAPKLTITYTAVDPTQLPFRTQMSVLRM